MSPLRHALKEWAVICQALAEGKQIVLLRKGGIAEVEGMFRVEHNRFWLFPTYVHQNRGELIPESATLLEGVLQGRPPEGTVRLDHFAEVTAIHRLHDLANALNLEGLHCWTQETVQKRYHYHTPGLYALAVRTYRANQTHEIPDTPVYAGCRSWVELDQELPAEGVPVLGEQEYQQLVRELEGRLAP